MIEVVHIINRFGKQLKFCLETEDDLSGCEPETIFYIQEYALGNVQPERDLPSVIREVVFDQYVCVVWYTDGCAYIIAARVPEFTTCMDCPDELDCEAWERCLVDWDRVS